MCSIRLYHFRVRIDDEWWEVTWFCCGRIDDEWWELTWFWQR
jgi:hypothetical protein